MEFKEIFGSPNRVNAELAKLAAEGWEPTGLITKGYNNFGQLNPTNNFNKNRRPTYLCVTLLRK
jgi:hypothetical protein